MMWQAIPYIVLISALVFFSKTGDDAVADVMKMNDLHGRHPARIEAILAVKGTQKWLDRAAFALAVIGNFHIATLAGLL